MIKERLLSLPDEIKEMKIKLINADNKLEHYNEEIKKWELQELDSIANAVDEKGKAIFSNDAKRKAELERRKENNKDYQRLLKALDEAKLERDLIHIELDRLYNEQGNLRAICRLEGGLDV